MAIKHSSEKNNAITEAMEHVERLKAKASNDDKLIYADVMEDISAKYRFFTDTVTSERFIITPNGDVNQYSGYIKTALSTHFYEAYGKPIVNLESIVPYFQGKCMDDRRETHQRCAQSLYNEKKQIVYRLTGEDSVSITPGGWSIIPTRDSGFLFRDGLASVDADKPIDTENKLSDLLMTCMPVFDSNIITYMGALVTMFMEQVSSPLVNITGPQGSFKTGVCSTTKYTGDPSTLHLGACGDNLGSGNDDLIIKLGASSIVFFDNLSSVSGAQSDILARAVTGGAQTKRVLYTDHDTFMTQLKSAVLMSGINNCLFRADALDRTINVELNRFEGKFESETKVYGEIEQFIPEIRGAICNLLVDVLSYEEEPINPINIRLTDYSTVTYLVGRACGFKDSQITAALQKNLDTNNDAASNASPVARWIKDNIAENSPYEGKITDLWKRMQVDGVTNYKSLRSFSDALKRDEYTIFRDGFVREKTNTKTNKFVLRIKNKGDKFGEVE